MIWDFKGKNNIHSFSNLFLSSLFVFFSKRTKPKPKHKKNKDILLFFLLCFV